ncbi:Carboxylesterase 5A [Branchiostoma belcheri]|nr:Carboxylesterase 5A [Branchiostoma belcheri]
MGNNHSHSMDSAPQGDVESTSPDQIEFDMIELREIHNKNPPYNGYLVEEYKRSRRNSGYTGKVVRTSLNINNMHRVIVQVYRYKQGSPVDGTHVVLQFFESGKYYYRKTNGKLRLKKGGFQPESAADITSAADPRVFLLKPWQTSRDHVIEWHGATTELITLLQQNGKPVQLQPYVDGHPSDGQVFKLEWPIFRRAAPGSDSLVPAVDVPFPYPITRLDGADKQSDEVRVELDD